MSNDLFLLFFCILLMEIIFIFAALFTNLDV